MTLIGARRGGRRGDRRAVLHGDGEADERAIAAVIYGGRKLDEAIGD